MFFVGEALARLRLVGIYVHRIYPLLSIKKCDSTIGIVQLH